MSRSESAAHRVPPYRRPIIIVGFLLILAVVIVVTVFVCKGISNNSSDNSSNGSSSNGNSTTTIPEPTVPDPEAKPEDKTPQYEGEDPNDYEELTGTIIYKDIDTDTMTLHSAVSIDQYLSEAGQCTFNVKQGDIILLTASAQATAEVTTSVCGPFSLPVSELAPGSYTIEVIMTGNGKRGVITDTIDI